MTLLLWLLIIVVLTFWHELGHYLAARAQGVGVKSFSIGMGPVLWRRMSGGTEWRLSALPIGGYVEIEGMANSESEGKVGFARLGALGKIAILLAGPVFNIILALFLLASYFTVQGIPTSLEHRAKVMSVATDSQAQKLGLRAGDVIVALNGKTLGTYTDVQKTLKNSGSKMLTFERDAQQKTVNFQWSAGAGKLLGISYGPDVRMERVNFFGGLAAAGRVTVGVVPLALEAFGKLFKNFLTLNVSSTSDPESGIVGPIGQVSLIDQAMRGGVWKVLLLAAGLNLSLAFFNLLPIPGLDGGRILLVSVQSALPRPLTFAQENLINLAGFMFVLLLMLFVIVSDIFGLFSR